MRSRRRSRPQTTMFTCAASLLSHPFSSQVGRKLRIEFANRLAGSQRVSDAADGLGMPFQIIAFTQFGSHVVGQAFALGVKARVVDARLVAARVHAVPALAVVQPNRIQAMETCSPGIIVAIAEALITQCRGNTAGTEYCGEQVRFRKTDPVPVTNDVGSRNADLLGSDVVAVGISVAHRFVSSTDG